MEEIFLVLFLEFLNLQIESFSIPFCPFSQFNLPQPSPVFLGTPTPVPVPPSPPSPYPNHHFQVSRTDIRDWVGIAISFRTMEYAG